MSVKVPPMSAPATRVRAGSRRIPRPGVTVRHMPPRTDQRAARASPSVEAAPRLARAARIRSTPSLERLRRAPPERDAHVPLSPGSECRARQHRDLRFVEAEVRELAVVHAGPRDVREAEQARLRHRAADAGDRVEGAGHEVAPLVQPGPDPGPDPGPAPLRRAERHRRRPLGHHVGAGHEVLVHLEHVRDEGGGPMHVADPPAGHRERLGEAVEGEGALGHAGEGRDAAVYGVRVDEVLEGLVREHEEIVAPGDRRDRPELGRPEHAAGGVVGGVEEDRPRPRGDARREVVPGQHRAASLAQRHADRLRSREPDEGVVGDPARSEEQHLVARVEAGLRRERDALLGSDGDDDVLRVGVDPVLPPELVRDHPAEVLEPGAQAVGHVPVVLVDRGVGLALDLDRGVELGGAGDEVEHVVARCAQALDAVTEVDRRRGHELAHALRFPFRFQPALPQSDGGRVAGGGASKPPPMYSVSPET